MITLQPQCLDGIDTLPGLQQALQNAIELEHATLPPYLYALYSLDQDENGEIYGLIKSVVMEEMGHFGYACNILNAIGGSPAIDDPSFVPSYPGPLPCGVESQLTVPLAPFSLDVVENVFMVIEEPEDPVAVAAAEGLTIGQFYDAIKEALVAQGSSIFTGNPDLQVTNGFPELTAVTDLDTATAAIDTIVEQGEGTTQSPDDQQGDLAHYYRFAEIYHGKALIQNPSPPPSWAYEGDPIPFDPAGVLPLVTNPKGSQYPQGSPAQQANDAFNATYRTLLQHLHSAFNGTPGDLNDAIGDMFTLKDQAAAVMAIELGDGTNAGPSFEYPASGA
ncbi:MAG TPA: ferritin-like protein [Thermoleophilaceae bacterium]|jgi:rubrerythrin